MNTADAEVPDPRRNGTQAKRLSGREFVVTRTFDAPRPAVFEAWSRAELFRRWWVPESAGLTLLSCELDVREGGTYRLVFSHPAAPQPMAFHGRYLEVVPPERLVWTNEEAGEAGQVSTVTLEDCDGRTRLVMHERYPTQAALDEAIATGGTCDASGETFDQLEALLAAAPGAA